MSDAAWALRTAREVGPIPPPHAYAHPIHKAHKLHTGPLHSTVAGRTDHLPSQVPNGSFVLPADIVSGLGEGNTMAGYKIAKGMFAGAHREFGGTPYAGSNGPYGQGTGLPYAVGHAGGGEVTPSVQPLTQDEEASPILYHGTNAPSFKSFNENKIGSGYDANLNGNGINGNGFYFTPSKERAMGYGRRIIPARLSLQNPLRIGKGTPHNTVYDVADKLAGREVQPGEIRGVLQSHGYDGIIKRDHHYPELDEHVAFHPDQIQIVGKSSKNRASGGVIGRNEKQTLIGPGTEEWEHGPSVGLPDSQNAVSGPTMPQGDQTLEDQLWNNRNRQDIIDQHIGTEMAKGGAVDQAVPVAVAGGEHVLAPHEVAFAGMGDVEAGHKALEAFVLRQRAKLIKTLKGLPGPKRD